MFVEVLIILGFSFLGFGAFLLIEYTAYKIYHEGKRIEEFEKKLNTEEK